MTDGGDQASNDPMKIKGNGTQRTWGMPEKTPVVQETKPTVVEQKKKSEAQNKNKKKQKRKRSESSSSESSSSEEEIQVPKSKIS